MVAQANLRRLPHGIDIESGFRFTVEVSSTKASR
jgi:hypothetical protein